MPYLSLLLLVVPLMAHADTSSPAGMSTLRIENAWVREAPPTAKVMAGYATFCNDGEQPATLVSAGSDNFSSIEMHVTVETNNAVAMQRLDEVVIGAGDCVAFEPGGRHFMLFNPSRALRSGDTVTFTLSLANGHKWQETFPVRRPGDAKEKSHHEHH